MSLTEDQRYKIADYVRGYLLHTAQSYGHKNAVYRATARWMHILNVLKNLQQICDGEHVSSEVREICEVAVMFHDVDHYTVSQEYHAVRGAETATRFMRQEGYPPEFIKRVADAVREHDRDLSDDLSVEEQVNEIINTLSLEARIVMDADTLDKIGASNILQSVLTMGLSKRNIAEVATELTSGWPLQRARLWKEMLTTPTGRAIGAQELKFYEHFLAQVQSEMVMADPFPEHTETLAPATASVG